MNVTLVPKFKWWYRPVAHCVIMYHLLLRRPLDMGLVEKIIDRSITVKVVCND